MIECKLDWLAFTWKASSFNGPIENEIDDFSLFMKVFPEFYKDENGMLLFKDCGHNKWYDHVFQFNEQFMIQYNVERVNALDPDAEQGVNVSVPAHGLGYFFKLMGYDWDHVDECLLDLKRRGCQFSRIDLAYDDLSMTFMPQDYDVWIARGQMVTNFRNYRLIGQTRQDRRGGCFYLGKRSAGRMLRIYDKDFESKGKIPAIRYEFELHGMHTIRFVDYIIENKEYPAFHDVLQDWIKKIVAEGSDKIRAQREPLPEWVEFIDSVKLGIQEEKKKIAPITKPSDTTDQLQRKWNWIVNQVAPTLHGFAVIFGFDTVASMLDQAGFSKTYEALQTLYYTDPKRYSSIKQGTGTVEYGRDYRNFW